MSISSNRAFLVNREPRSAARPRVCDGLLFWMRLASARDAISVYDSSHFFFREAAIGR